jgi:hypothetical protein
MRTLSLRAIFLIGFVIVMPLLALPAVARRLDDWLYGPAPQSVSQSRLRKELAAVVDAPAAEGISPASFEEISAAATDRRAPRGGLDAEHAPPPRLDPLPAFDRYVGTAESASSSAPDATPLGVAATDRLVQIRGQLEALGAEYILLETTDGSGSYHFRCQMSASDSAPNAREFEAIAADPLVAAERVLAEVSAWRTAAGNQKLR